MTNLIIIDASGSMSSKVPEVVGGLKQLFNQIKDDYKSAKKKIKPTTIVVDFSGAGDFIEIINSKDLKQLTDDVAESYSVRGMTALYDAIGKGFNLVDKKEKNVFVSILTDGGENDSKEFHSQQIKDLIDLKKKEGWAITFMGTSEQDIQAAVNLGISRGNTMSFSNDAAGAAVAMNKMSMTRATYYNAVVTDSLSSLDTFNLMVDTQENKDLAKRTTKKK